VEEKLENVEVQVLIPKQQVTCTILGLWGPIPNLYSLILVV